MSDDKKPYHISLSGSRLCPDEKLLQAAVVELVHGRPDVRVWLLRGTLGAGKTTVVRGVARALGVTKTITSPTYTLRQEYSLSRGVFHSLVHVDAYRIKNISEVDGIGITDDLQNLESMVWIEWPERIEELPLLGAAHLHIEIIPGGRRLRWTLPASV